MIRIQHDKKGLLNIINKWPELMDYTGLTEYEAKIYLGLISLGTACVRELTLYCNVPRTKIYETLRRLQDGGLVTEMSGSPKLFSPMCPERAFSALLSNVKKKTIKFSTMLQSLKEIQEQSKKKTDLQQMIVWYFNGNSDLNEKCEEIIRNTQNSLFILTCEDGLALLFNSCHRTLDEMYKRGVEVKIFSPLNPKNNSLARELSYIFEVKRDRILTPILLIVSDLKRMLLGKIAQRGDIGVIESAIFSDDPDFLSIISLFRYSTWKNASTDEDVFLL